MPRNNRLLLDLGEGPSPTTKGTALPRPKVPLISKRKTLEAALRIIDTEGLESRSVRRLAIELNVNASSRYHHFHNKEEILVGAAALAKEEVRTPETHDEDRPVWLMRNGVRLHKAWL